MAKSATAGESGIDIDGYPDYRGVPVIGSALGEFPRFFTAQTGVISNSPDFWVRRMAELLEDAPARAAMAEAAFAAFRHDLSLDVVAGRVARALRSVLDTRARPTPVTVGQGAVNIVP